MVPSAVAGTTAVVDAALLKTHATKERVIAMGLETEESMMGTGGVR